MSFKSIRENLKNPKKKSLTLLGLYIVFFIIVFILINTGGSDTIIDETDTKNIDIEKEDTISNYEYTYTIYDNESLLEINGIYDDSVNKFNYNGFNYIEKNDEVYLDNIPVQLEFSIYNYQEIKLLIENSDSETKYKDSDKKVYNISATKYFELLNEFSNFNNLDCDNIFITITVHEDEFINNVIIDLSNYYNYKYIIEIEYKLT